MVPSAARSDPELIAFAVLLASTGATPEAYDSVSDVARVLGGVLKEHIDGDTPKALAERAIDAMLKELDPWSRRITPSATEPESKSFVCLVDRGVLRLTIRRFNGDGRRWIKECPALDQNLPVLIDLRDNPGGEVADALGLASLFVSEVDLLVEERRSGQRTRHRASPQRVRHASLTVLVNQQTASAAELIAAALERSAGAHVLGERTMGKTTVQTAVYLSTGDVVLLTTGRLYLPDGRALEGAGLVPKQPVPTTPSAYACRLAKRTWSPDGCQRSDAP